MWTVPVVKSAQGPHDPCINTHVRYDFIRFHFFSPSHYIRGRMPIYPTYKGERERDPFPIAYSHWFQG